MEVAIRFYDYHLIMSGPYLNVVDADAAVGEEAVLGALARDQLAADDRLREEVRDRRVPVAEVLRR